MPNVTSETHRKWWFFDDFWYILATFSLAAAMNMNFNYLSSCRCRGFCCCCWSPDTKTQWHGYFFLLLLLWILATCCCYEYEVWLPFPPAGPRIGKHHCSGKTPWQWRTEKPQNCSPKIPNVTSETYRKWWFWRLSLLAAMNFGYLFLLPLQRLLLLLLLVPG